MTTHTPGAPRPISGRPASDIAGQTFERWRVLARSKRNASNGGALWICVCSCGNRSVVPGYKLRSGRSRSCGCLQRECVRAALTTHGMRKTKVYNAWQAMIDRCTNPRNASWNNYGGRGISVCSRWRTFANFLRDMGEPPPGLSLDRFPDNNGDYRPDNCRWSTAKQQSLNMRTTVWINHNGEKRTSHEWSQLTGIQAKTICERIRRGWTTQKALYTPTQTRST